MDFSSKEYLPDSGYRIAHLQKIINGRPVAILAAGPSIQELEARIGELRGADICYFGLNNFFVQETHILGQIGKHASLIMYSCDCMENVIDRIISFLDREEDNMFISSLDSDPFGRIGGNFSLGRFIDAYDWKLLFFRLDGARTVPNKERPLHFIKSNSVLLLIQLALIGKASSIVLFGADGHCGVNVKDYYYRQDEYEPLKFAGADLCLINDTILYFNPIAAQAIKNTCLTYGVPLVNILNCSPKSHYTPFLKVSYDAAFEYLLTGRKIIGNLDLRVPRSPKTPNAILVFFERSLNFFKKYGWNSPSAIAAKFWKNPKVYAKQT